MRSRFLLTLVWAVFPLLTMSSCAMARTSIDTAQFNPAAWGVNGDSTTLRVRVLHTRSAVRIGGTGAWEYCPMQGGPCRSTTSALRVRRSSRGIFVNNHTVRGGLWARPASEKDFLSVNGRSYRGKLRVVAAGRGMIDVIEYVDLEEYLYGVLPREVGADWPLEALKAQAVISRTFALANKAENAAQPYDMSNDVRFQVYGGRSDEAPAPIRAVDGTQGEVLVDAAGLPIQAFFHSSCGGMTDKPGNVWNANYPDDLFGVTVDTFCVDDPYRTWHLSLNASTIKMRLGRAGVRVGTVKDIQIGKRSPSGRAQTLLLIWRGGKKEVSGNKFRLAVGPEAFRSTLLSEISHSGKRFDFTGHGWGHGVGLCQWGARGRATAGQTYDQILKAYYPGATLRKPAAR